jgi:hypothetical protein
MVISYIHGWREIYVREDRWFVIVIVGFEGERKDQNIAAANPGFAGGCGGYIYRKGGNWFISCIKFALACYIYCTSTIGGRSGRGYCLDSQGTVYV